MTTPLHNFGPVFREANLPRSHMSYDSDRPDQRSRPSRCPCFLRDFQIFSLQIRSTQNPQLKQQ